MRRVTFPARAGCYDTIKRRVRAKFEDRGVPVTGNWRMFLKTAFIIALVLSTYVYLLFFSSSILSTCIAAFFLAHGFVMVGFNIMHDGSHGSYSRNKTVNWIMAFTLDFLGGSHIMWHQKHNILHHTYTNIAELDDDLHTSGLIRLSPEQKWRPWHRFQHLYAFPVYSLLTLSWLNFNDFPKLFSGRIGHYKLRKPKASDVSLFFLTKIFYIGYALVLPLFFHPFLKVLIAFLAIHLILGFTLSIIFQLAHTVDGNTFPRPAADTASIENEWAIHEV